MEDDAEGSGPEVIRNGGAPMEDGSDDQCVSEILGQLKQHQLRGKPAHSTNGNGTTNLCSYQV